MTLTSASQRIKTILKFPQDHGGSCTIKEWEDFEKTFNPPLHIEMEDLINNDCIRLTSERYELTDKGKTRLAELEELENNPDLMG